ncbi:unnamed protein product [marine sediment metagenome]|uniref:Uncharacterized protein n=1 Tax=marine sediment metagenome TaxID=412755 RepID=X1BP27_9ZZZZ
MKTKKVIIPAYGDEIIGDARVEVSIQCLACKHFHNDMTTCKAFSKGIPIKILTGHWDHTRPFRNDNGIRFERIV